MERLLGDREDDWDTILKALDHIDNVTVTYKDDGDFPYRLIDVLLSHQCAVLGVWPNLQETAMRLSHFLIENIKPIVHEWENFARTLPTTGKPLDAEALRDHAERMIRTIAADLNTEQSAEQQIEKSYGHGPSRKDSAATSHAVGRLITGFSINQVVAEFRALRASVMRL